LVGHVLGETDEACVLVRVLRVVCVIGDVRVWAHMRVPNLNHSIDFPETPEEHQPIQTYFVRLPIQTTHAKKKKKKLLP
jgi:hypothetical protein